jgi:glucose-1-phosphate cytidylyltransferase
LAGAVLRQAVDDKPALTLPVTTGLLKRGLFLTENANRANNITAAGCCKRRRSVLDVVWNLLLRDNSGNAHLCDALITDRLNGVDMKAVILAGGLGTRLSEETATRPKPMVEIGGKPILWHIMKIYSHHGIRDFVICCGHKGYVIKEFFANYSMHMSDVTFDLQANSMQMRKKRAEPWKVTLVDTGEASMTGGRLGRVADYVKNEESFCFTYGDGVGDIDISATIEYHRKHGKLATLTATSPPGRFGAIDIQGGQVLSFNEKPKGDGAMINGGFFVLSPKVLKYIKGDSTTWEKEPLMSLAEDGELMAYEHHGFWLPMDTLRDKQLLEDLWATGKAPWKMWD